MLKQMLKPFARALSIVSVLGLTMVPRENKNNAYAKFGGTYKDYYGICPIEQSSIPCGIYTFDCIASK